LVDFCQIEDLKGICWSRHKVVYDNWWQKNHIIDMAWRKECSTTLMKHDVVLAGKLGFRCGNGLN
jgi:hypothetical protein